MSLAWFPVSYAVHLAEEAWGGESFPIWASRMSGASFSRDEFVILNAVAFAMMCAVVAATRAWPSTKRVAVPALGTVVAANGTLHAAASLWTSTYSPGLLSGLVLWLPLGVQALRSSARSSSPRDILAGCAVGVLAHVSASSIAFFW